MERGRQGGKQRTSDVDKHAGLVEGTLGNTLRNLTGVSEGSPGAVSCRIIDQCLLPTRLLLSFKS